MRTTSQFNIH